MIKVYTLDQLQPAGPTATSFALPAALAHDIALGADVLRLGPAELAELGSDAGAVGAVRAAAAPRGADYQHAAARQERTTSIVHLQRRVRILLFPPRREHQKTASVLLLDTTLAREPLISVASPAGHDNKSCALARGCRYWRGYRERRKLWGVARRKLLPEHSGSPVDRAEESVEDLLCLRGRSVPFATSWFGAPRADMGGKVCGKQ